MAKDIRLDRDTTAYANNDGYIVIRRVLDWYSGTAISIWISRKDFEKLKKLAKRIKKRKATYRTGEMPCCRMPWPGVPPPGGSA